MITITLYPAAYNSGIATAQMRQAASEQASQAREYSGDSLYAHTVGCKGEVAFSLFYNLPYRHSVNEFALADFTSPLGNGIDVKCSPKHSNLLVAEKHIHAERIYVATQLLSNDTVAIIGWISGTDILEHKEWKCNPGNRGPAYLVKARDLNKFATKSGRNQ